MIMALGVGYMKPQKAILDAAQNLPMVPTLMAHIRRSDKAVDVRKCSMGKVAGACLLTYCVDSTNLCDSFFMLYSYIL